MWVGKYLKEARINNNMSQEVLAEKLGVSRQTISSWESTKSYPDIENIIKISNLYNIPIDRLLKGNRDNYERSNDSDDNFKELYLKIKNEFIDQSVSNKRYKLAISNSFKKQINFNSTNDDFNSYNYKIGNIIGNIKNATFEVVVTNFEVLCDADGSLVMMQIADDTGKMIAVLVLDNEELEAVSSEIVIGQKYRMRGIVSIKSELTGDKTLIIRAIQKS